MHLATLPSPDAARFAVSKVRSATKGPFVINYILRVPPASLRDALDAGAPAVQFSWGMPTKEMVSAIRAAGAKLGMQVTSAESARVALDLGADYLVCQGMEAGGHVQASRGLYEALPAVLEEARRFRRHRQWERNPQSAFGRCVGSDAWHTFHCNRREYCSSVL